MRRTAPTKHFPKTLQDFIQQKQWERFDVETEQKRVRTAYTTRVRAERYAEKYGINPEQHVKKLFPKSRSMEELASLPHHKAPRTIRMTNQFVPPITKTRYVVPCILLASASYIFFFISSMCYLLFIVLLLVLSLVVVVVTAKYLSEIILLCYSFQSTKKLTFTLSYMFSSFLGT